MVGKMPNLLGFYGHREVCNSVHTRSVVGSNPTAATTKTVHLEQEDALFFTYTEPHKTALC